MNTTMTIYACPNCSAELDPERSAAGDWLRCPHCQTQQRHLAFPRLWQTEREAITPIAVQSDEEAHCAYHEENRAETPCDRCGRYICSVCTLPLEEEEKLCPDCLNQMQETWAQNKETAPYKVEQLRYDLIIQYMAVLPILFFSLALFTGPIVFVLGLYWLPRVRRIPECKLTTHLIGLFIAGLQSLALIFLIGIFVMVLSSDL